MSQEAPAGVKLDICGIPDQPLLPGAPVGVRVVISSENRISVTELRVLVTRTDTVSPTGHHLIYTSSTRVHPEMSRRIEHVVFRTNIIDKGEQHIVNMPDDDGLANNEAQVAVTIPDHNPDTWQGGNYGSITYRLRVVMTYLRWSDDGSVRLTKEHNIGCSVDLRVRNVKLISPQPVLKSRTRNKMFRSILLKSGMLTAKLEIPSELRQGQTFTASVEVTNDTSRAITSASLTLYQWLWLNNGRMYPQETMQPLSSVLIPQALLKKNTQWSGQVTDLTVPEGSLTSASFTNITYLQIRFFVRLRLELKWTGSLNVDLDVMLGSDLRRADPASRPSSQLRNNLRIRRAFVQAVAAAEGASAAATA